MRLVIHTRQRKMKIDRSLSIIRLELRPSRQTTPSGRFIFFCRQVWLTAVNQMRLPSAAERLWVWQKLIWSAELLTGFSPPTPPPPSTLPHAISPSFQLVRIFSISLSFLIFFSFLFQSFHPSVNITMYSYTSPSIHSSMNPLIHPLIHPSIHTIPKHLHVSLHCLRSVCLRRCLWLDVMMCVWPCAWRLYKQEHHVNYMAPYL